jgi:hypothetical protein
MPMPPSKWDNEEPVSAQEPVIEITLSHQKVVQPIRQGQQFFVYLIAML